MGLPTGPRVTFLFTDIEGSTRLERSVGSAAWAAVVGRHDEVVRTSVESHGGVVVKTEGDAFFAAFDAPAAAVSAAVAAQRAIGTEPWPHDLAIRVRMGLHLGEGHLRMRSADGEPEDYVGIDVNYAARIAAAGNGGQIVLSAALVAALPQDLAPLAGMGDVNLVNDGPRSVKDFDDPIPLFRLVVPGAADDPRPLRTLDAPSNLPGDVTALVGRQDEIDTIAGELERRRILTLTGPGGSGKTRLAVAVGRRVRDRFPHGVWFVDLAAVRDPALLLPAIAATLHVRESPQRTVDDALLDHLRDRTAMLLLDNLEQLLPEGGDIVARLARNAPNVSVLVTSRELLRITGEAGHAVPPLGVEAGMELFVDRAREHRPDLVLDNDALAAIRAICERLGGLPLALELAAARIRLLGPALILERLGRSLDLGGGARDLPERQRTLRGAVTWSYELLSPQERRLFGRLGIFASGWTREMALSVADPDGTLGLDLVDGLESLADKSFVRIEVEEVGEAAPGERGTRFSLHPLLREYALERLEDCGERPVTESRFSAVCVDIAETAGRAILGPAEAAAMRRLDREDRNLRTAVDWALRNDEPDLGLRIIGATWRWFHQRGRLREARALLAQLLAHPSGADALIRIRGLAAEGGLAYWMDDFAGARVAYEERLALASKTGDRLLLADAHYDVGFLSMVANEGELLRVHEEQALALYTAAGSEEGVIRARQALVLAVFLAGEYETARELETQNLDAFRRSGSHYQVADSLTLLSAVHWRLGEAATSWLRLCDALGYFSRLDSASGLARGLGMASIVLLTNADAELGARVAGAVYRLVREKGVMFAPVKVLHLPDPAVLAAVRFGSDGAAERMDEGGSIPIDEMVAQVLAAAPPAV